MKRKTLAIVSAVVLVIAVCFFVVLAIRMGWFPPKKPPKKPKKVVEEIDVRLAKLILAEQQQSRISLRRFAEGEIKVIVIDRVTKNSSKAVADIIVTYIDDSQLGGTAEFICRDGDWYITKVEREYDPAAPPQKPKSIEAVTESETRLGKKMVAEQKRHQDLVVDMVSGKIKSIDIDDVDKGFDRSLVSATITYADGHTLDGTARLEYLEGYWYLLKLNRKKT